MRLTHKFILIYLLISLVVFLVGGVFSYYTLSDLVDKETDNEIGGQSFHVFKMIERDIPLDILNEDDEMDVKILTDTVGLRKSSMFYDTMAEFSHTKQIIRHRKGKFVKRINEQWYQLEIRNTTLEEDDTFYGSFVSTSVIYIILVVFSLLSSFILSRLLLSPFNATLEQIKLVNIQKGIGIHPGKVNTREFRSLNEFLKKMTDRAISDYRNLQEFSENSAHEIKTPLAIASGKLDLLLQTKDLDDKQLQLITEAQNSIQKISKIQSTLSILSKIENEEFNKTQAIDVSELIEKSVKDHQDIIDFKKIHLKLEVAPGVSIKNDPILVEMLFSNLLQNAIKHNVEQDGLIHVKLSTGELEISNTGKSITSSPDQLLERFKKDSTNGDSLGLGLSIVKNICDRSGYSLTYDFRADDQIHALTIRW